MIDEKTVRRFWSRVDRRGEEECWHWSGPLNGKGYGQVQVNGTTTGVHRLSYMIHKGDIAPGLVIDHQCRTRNCVNPAHLRAVTPRINALENNVGLTATNARKTHCYNGHPFTPENTISDQGARRCKQCHSVNRRRYYYRVEKKVMAARRAAEVSK